MRKILLISSVSLFGLITLLTITGCQEEELSTDIRQARFIANENRKLKDRLDQCRAEVEKCHRQTKTLKEENQQTLTKMMNIFVEQRRELQTENKQLRQQLKELKKQRE